MASAIVNQGAMLTRPWPEIIASFEPMAGRSASIKAILELCRRINGSPLSSGLYGWTSLTDLCIVQTPVTYPYEGPYLRVRPVSEGLIEFRFIDTYLSAEQWNRTVPSQDASARLLWFLAQLTWFPPHVLASIESGEAK